MKAPPLDPVEIHRTIILQARERGLDNLARAIAGRRDARAVKNKQLRAQIEADMRENLDSADAFIREARAALLVGDVARYESNLKDARIEWLIALNKLKNPLAKAVDERDARNAHTSKKGGEETAKKFAKPELDELIRGCLLRGEKTRNYSKEWQGAFDISADVVERHINLIKAEFAKR